MALERSFGDVDMTTNSPTQSFYSTGSAAMDIDSDSSTAVNEDLTNRSPSSSPITPNKTLQQPSITTANATNPPLPAFPLFPLLPPKLRTRIWTLACPAPRVRFLELHTYNTIDYLPRLCYHPRLPPLFSVCNESRKASIEHDGGEIIAFNSNTMASIALFGIHDYAHQGHMYANKNNQPRTPNSTEKIPSTTTTPPPILPPTLYFNFSLHTFYLPPRFTAAATTTETARLTSLTTLLPLRHLRRIQRLLVTYSGRDTFAGIGPALRPFAGLETLYIGMEGSEGVRVGSVGEKVEGLVRGTEEEETEDDEEGEEVLAGRLA
ncbi:hypothetical protein BDW02DRAFT_584215, partial [Decorospora gaudefroyi]